jgi:hypothetical protein
MQNGEIRRQPRPRRTGGMDSRASHDTYRAARFPSPYAPPAPGLATQAPVVAPTTAPGAALAPSGAGAVVRAGTVVAPVPPGDGSGTVHHPRDTTAASPQTDTGLRYLPRNRSAMPCIVAGGLKVSIRAVAPMRCVPRPVRCDRSLHGPPRPGAGTRSGDRRDVSLSPVPASHSSPATNDKGLGASSPSGGISARIRRLCMAQPHP